MKADYKSVSHPLRRTIARCALGFVGTAILMAILIFSHLSLQPSELKTPPTALGVTKTTATIDSEKSQPLAQNASPEKEPFSLRTIIVQAGDTLSSLFARLGISPKTMSAILSTGEASQILSSLKPNQKLELAFDQDQSLQSLKIDYTPAKTLFIVKQDDTFIAQEQHRQEEIRRVVGSGEIESSLFEAGQKAAIDDKILLALADIFAWDIDFALDIQRHDKFKVLYEAQYIDGEHVGSGSILAAEFVNAGKVYRDVRFTDPNGHTDYYTPEGLSLHKAFIRTPVKFSHISSYFSMGRKHPILHTLRAHRGVDYAAPPGTPVKAAGDGEVVEMGWKGGYGKTVMLKHGDKYSTLYAHLSSFAPRLKPGKMVRQGDVIGAVGSTGLATGPHLHYEFRVNGVHRDPLTVPLPKALPISERHKLLFQNHQASIMEQLNDDKVLAQTELGTQRS